MGSLVQAHPEAQARLFRSNIRDSLFWFCPINIAEVLVSRKNIGEEMMLSRKTWGKGFPDPYTLIIIVYYLSRLIPLPQTKHSMK